MLQRKFPGKWWGVGIFVFLTVVISALVVGCQGPVGPSGPVGPAGPAGTSSSGAATGTLSGKITNSLTKAGVSGAQVVTDPVIGTQAITTDSSGAFSATLPIGSYKITISKAGYTAATDAASLVAGQTATRDIALVPAKPVGITIAAATANPGAAVTLKGVVTPLDGSTVTSYAWSQTVGAKATLGDTKGTDLAITLPSAQVYKDELLKNLNLLDRWMVQAIAPEVLINAETSTFKLTVVTSSGTYSAAANITANLPYDFTSGLAAIPKGVPVLLNGKKQASYNWTVAGPAGSTAGFDSATVRNPFLTPDVAGKYVLTEKVSNTTFNIYAGTWAGAITGQDAAGRPLAAGCTACHNGTVAPDNFTPWAKTGHAEILTQNIDDPAGHWSLSCAECHSVGYNTTITNGGFDEAIAAESWKAPAHPGPGNWADMLKNYPKSAKLANIQCENCHGPNNDNGLHPDGAIDPARVSLSADVCGVCHGEPPRHGRFQQWQESAHGNYATAIAESTSANCARCHTAQGFLTWISQGDLTKQIQGKSGNATAAELAAIVTPDNAQPQTCAVCHDPHAIGTTTGLTTNAKVRIFDNTLLLPAGFKAEVVGKGAICITCHNTRNLVHNNTAAPTAYQAPHTAAQGDVLMGENAYFVDVEARSPHSLIKDTCVTCHLEESPAPAEYSLPGNGTNHGFTASIDICGECHSDKLNGEALQAGFEGKLGDLENALTAYLVKKLPASFTILEYTPHDFGGKSYDVKADPVVISKDNIASITLTEPHGQQGYIFKLKTAVSFTYKPANENPHSMSLTTVQAQLGDITTDGTAKVVPFTDNLVKAGWNYFLLHGDSSKGVHNPQWEIDVLNASINALK